ncbi:uncharacterized protein PFL1_02207 [Pseudozyma flocculosa PF-1]|uniref:Uncharacterized protein n=1 Tax=Pseudozyma flocculosa TaxID=84751 RepID=A0A5C3FBD9_9BASI|nr:uncharacterized protein PFL1_02207 [Pseudozyma flocculosa PF-1]EPQ30090.1 hypothetical protein PFL1_02207 [Pseudozyma flocculosa PF-1]SPO41436.1 uncharacterized protein PSFLO_06918 [Pseudozyma flocculosa]
MSPAASPSPDSLAAPPLLSDHAEWQRLIAHRRALHSLRQANLNRQKDLSLTLDQLYRVYRGLCECLRWLDQADLCDLEDRAAEVVRIDQQPEDDATQCPFASDMIRQTPLLRQQAVERAEFDMLLAGSPWSNAEDQQLQVAVMLAARKALAFRPRTEDRRGIDPMHLAANATEEELLRCADVQDHHGSVQDGFQHLDWNMVASRVPSRNAEECRTRWIQVLRPSISCAPWSSTELKRLESVVALHLAESRYEPIPWDEIASTLPIKRTGFAAFVAYNRIAPPNPPFTPSEDDQLRRLFDLFSGAWKLITLHHPSARPNYKLYSRFARSIDPGITRGKWTAEEDAALVEAVARHGERDWKTIATRIGARTGSQCRDRYKNRLEPRGRLGVAVRPDSAPVTTSAPIAAAGGTVAVGRDSAPFSAATIATSSTVAAAATANAPIAAIASAAAAQTDATGRASAEAHMPGSTPATSTKAKKTFKRWTEEETAILSSLLDAELEPPAGQSWASIAQQHCDKVQQASVGDLDGGQGGSIQLRPISAKQARDRAATIRKQREEAPSGRASSRASSKGSSAAAGKRARSSPDDGPSQGSKKSKRLAGAGEPLPPAT